MLRVGLGGRSDEQRLDFPVAEEQFTQVQWLLEQEVSCRRFQVRLTDISSNVAIKTISVDASAFPMDNYSR